jgi:hypothetical protein
VTGEDGHLASASRAASKRKGADMKKTIGLVLVGAMALTLIIGGVTGASAQSATSGAVIRTGHCSGPSTWKLTLKRDAGRIESDVEVQTPRAGQTWRFAMFDNGVKFGSGTKTTLADGSWSATRFAANQLGTDHIVVRAANQTTGETCRAAAAF